ncbi:MAG: NB-ARC domain-containing protein, partial [Cyanobacteria bacterium P01_H01_bin.58]
MTLRQQLESELSRITDEVAKDLELLKAIEDRLRSEGDPRRTYQLTLDRDDLKQRIQARQADLASIEAKIRAADAVANLTSTITRNTQGTRQDWGGAPETASFFGRAQELTTLEEWVVDQQCRVIAILGIGGVGKTGLSLKLGRGGIGKTDLSLKFAKGLEDQFEAIIWRKLLNAPPLSEILEDIFTFLSDQQVLSLPESLDEQLTMLIGLLRQQRCLIMLDNVETILQGGDTPGQYRPGYEGYGQLFAQIGETTHQSCLLLTSREKPREIARLEGKTKPVRCFNLSGLDTTEGRRIFEACGTFTGTEADWQAVIQFYNGNPLALELAARHIEEVFFGDLTAFLETGTPVFEDLRELLDWHFQRLSEQERETLYWLAINREPMTLAELREDLLSKAAKTQLPSTLQALQRRLPLERNQRAFSLQPVLIEYLTERLIQQGTEEIVQHQIGLLNTHAFLKASAKDYIRESQARSILAPIAAQLGDRFSNPQALGEHLMAIVTQTQAQTPIKPGYVIGNVLNILRQCGLCVHGGDFSQLVIWQAYLQGWTLQDVNLTGSDLSKSVFTQRFGTVSAVAFSPNGNTLAAGIVNGDIRFWNVNDGSQHLICRGHTEWPWAIAYSPDGRLLASGSQDKTVRLWDTQTGQCLHVLEGHTNWVKCVAFSPDGQTVASGSNDETICVWDTRTGTHFYAVDEHSDWVWSLAFHPSGDAFISGSRDGLIKVWDRQSGRCLNTLAGHEDDVKAVAISPDGRFIASGGFDRTVRLWDWETGNCLRILEGHTAFVWSVLFSSDGQRLLSNGDDQTTRIWQVATGHVLKVVKERTGRVWSITMSSPPSVSGDPSMAPDVSATSVEGGMVASSSEDQTVRLWDSQTGQTIKTLWGYSSVVWAIAFNADGTQLVSSTDQGVQIWQTKDWRCSDNLQEYTGKSRSVAFSPEGTQVASGCDDGNVRL